MKIKTAVPILALAALPLLAGCVSDAASMQIDGKEHSLSLVREQKWLWDDKFELFVVVTRMPDCQRRHRLKSAAAATFEVFSLDFVTFYIKQGGKTYSVETRTCELFRELSEPPASGMGQKIGSFREIDGKFSFVEVPVAAGGDRAADAATSPAR